MTTAPKTTKAKAAPKPKTTTAKAPAKPKTVKAAAPTDKPKRVRKPKVAAPPPVARRPVTGLRADLLRGVGTFALAMAAR